MEPQILSNLLLRELEEIKGSEILSLNVTEQTPIADYMIICSAGSTRHAKAICKHVQKELKEKGIKLSGISGEENGEWIIMDFGSSIIHIMQPQVRAFYNLEGIWQQNSSKERPANES